MMHRQNLVVIKILFVLLYLAPWSVAANSGTERIAFGSCLHESEIQPAWDAISKLVPDAFVFLGDNVYADTTDPDEMRASYAMLGEQPGYQALRDIAPVYATWDDHDYGANDAGAEYPMRETSEQIFLDFFQVPDGAPERDRPGVYSSRFIGTGDRRIQLILLDTRYFRDPLKEGRWSLRCPRTRYAPNNDRSVTLLGDAQWQWLAGELQKPAALRIIGSSIQVIPEQHCFEKWANFPHERQRLFELIGESGANGVVFISGDRHMAEISSIDVPEVGYRLYEITSSSLNATGGYGEGEHNRHRVTEDNFRADNFGVIELDWTVTPPMLELEVRDVDGKVVMYKEVGLETLARSGRFPGYAQLRSFYPSVRGPSPAR